MNTNIPQEIADTGLEWTSTDNNAQYVASDDACTYYCHPLSNRFDLTILRYGNGGWTSANACRPTAAEALAVARRMIEAAQ